MQNPHDKFFKATFSNPDVVKDFITHFVPPPIKKLIDLSTLELQKDSFVNKKLQENFSDLLFKTKIKDRPAYLHFLFEHKSYLSKNVSLQLLGYMLEIWNTIQEENHSERLPIIMPIVIYHGKESWSIPPSLGGLIEGYDDFTIDVQKYVPNFEYFLYDVSNYQDIELKINVFLRILFLLFRDIHKQNPEEILKTIFRSFDALKQLDNQETAIQYLETMMRYIFHANRQLTKDKFHDMITYVEDNYSEGSDRVMTLAEIFREEGKIELQVKNTIQLITKFVAPVPDQLEERINQQDLATLETIIMNIDEWKSLEEIEKILK